MGRQDKWAIQIGCFEDGEGIADPLLKWNWIAARQWVRQASSSLIERHETRETGDLPEDLGGRGIAPGRQHAGRTPHHEQFDLGAGGLEGQTDTIPTGV